MSEQLSWRKSTFSGSQANCVEVGTTVAGRAAGIRDSKSPDRGHLAVTRETFAAFLADVKRGAYDHRLAPRTTERLADS
jgi:hypothetical protein